MSTTDELRALIALLALLDEHDADKARIADLQQALVNHNDVLRSAYQIAAREGESTNWEGFTKRAGSVLAFHLEEVNAAREALEGKRP